MKKLKKRTCKGMTLAEIIISLAVLSALTLVLVTTAGAINSYMRGANNVNNKVCRQAPVAEVGYFYAAREIDTDVTITVEYGGKAIEIEGIAYSVEEESNIKSIDDPDYNPGDALNMKFIRFKPAPSPT